MHNISGSCGIHTVRLLHIMPRGARRSAESSLLSELEQMDQLFQASGKVTSKSSFKVLTFNKKAEGELFTEQCGDASEANVWLDREILLYLRGCLEGTARVYGQGSSASDILESLWTKYGTSVRQEKDHLLGLKRDSQESVFDLAMEIGCLVTWLI